MMKIQYVKLLLFILISTMVFIGCAAENRADTLVEISESDMLVEESKSETNQVAYPENGLIEKKEQERLADYNEFESKYEPWLSRNLDFVGWISIPNAEVSEAVVRGDDNQEYLRQSIDGEYSQAGTVFMDYRNIGNEFDDHMILYGHNLKDDQMFGPLRKFLEPSYAADHQTIQYESLYGSESYRVFSIYRIQAENYQYIIEFDGGMDDYLVDLVERSEFELDQLPEGELKILTLSTCSYEEKNQRLVIHAYLLRSIDE